MTAMEGFAGEMGLQENDEEHADHEPTDQPRGGMGLRQQGAERDGGEDGGGAGETGFHEFSPAKTALRARQSNCG